MNDEVFADRLKSVYFTCMTQLPLYSIYPFLNYVSSEIQKAVQAKYIGIYQKNQWSNQFELVTEKFCQKHKSTVLEATKKIEHSMTQYNHKDPMIEISGYKLLTIPIYNDFQLNYYLVII